MAELVIELPPREQQNTFNQKRWAEVLADPSLAKIEGRIETDRHGHIIMTPPPAFEHGGYQILIGQVLPRYLQGGRIHSECPISTRDGVRSPDVAWISDSLLATLPPKPVCLTTAPEICIEILSPSNSTREIEEKTALYFDAGAREVWLCKDGTLTFLLPTGPVPASPLAPDFPTEVTLSPPPAP